MVIEFKLLKVVPANNEDDDTFAELDMLLTSGRMSSAIGWVVGCGEDLECHREEILSFADMLKGTFSGRMKKNWATILLLS